MRGIAILLAMGWHLGVTDSGNPVIDALWWPSKVFGWAGVDLFFVLSGFLMGRIVYREYQKTGSFDSKRFLLRRAFKLWPVLYVFLIAQLILGDNSWETFFFQNFFHVQNYVISAHAHLWSLAVEEHFYLGLALLAPLVFRFRPSPRATGAGLCALLIVPLGLRVASQMSGASPIELQTLTHFRIDGLAAGVLLAYIAVAHPPVFARLLRMRLLWLCLTLGCVVFVTVFAKDTVIGSTFGYSATWVGAASFILLLHKTRWISRYPRLWRPLAALGVFSYSLYLWHIAAARLAEKFALLVLPAVDPTIQMFLNYGLGILVAVTMTKLIEWPALKLRNRILPPTSQYEPAPRTRPVAALDAAT